MERTELPRAQVPHPLAARRARAVPGALLGFGLGLGLALGITTLQALRTPRQTMRRKTTNAVTSPRPARNMRPVRASGHPKRSCNSTWGRPPTNPAISMQRRRHSRPRSKPACRQCSRALTTTWVTPSTRLGERDQKANPQQTIERWQGAVKSYTTALQMRPGDADAKFNRDFVQRKIDELQQPPPPPQSGGGQQQQPPGGGQQQKSPGSGSGSGAKLELRLEARPRPKSGPGPGPESASGPRPESRPGPESAARPGLRSVTSEPATAASQLCAATARQPRVAYSRTRLRPTRRRGRYAIGQPGGSISYCRCGRRPGELTREEAEHLLDSLKGDERRMSAAALGPDSNTAADSPPLKDW